MIEVIRWTYAGWSLSESEDWAESGARPKGEQRCAGGKRVGRNGRLCQHCPLHPPRCDCSWPYEHPRSFSTSHTPFELNTTTSRRFTIPLEENSWATRCKALALSLLNTTPHPIFWITHRIRTLQHIHCAYHNTPLKSLYPRLGAYLPTWKNAYSLPGITFGLELQNR